MAKIKRYKLKNDITKDELLSYGFKLGGSWINKDADIFISKNFYFKKSDFEFSINIALDSNTLDFDDFDNVLVIDEDFGQPYTPFYDYFDENVSDFKVLEYVINCYNTTMDGYKFLDIK